MKIRPHFYIAIKDKENYECAILPLVSFGRRENRFYVRLVWLVFSIGVRIETKVIVHDNDSDN